MKKKVRLFKYDNVGWLFVLPAVIYMLVFEGYSIFSNIILSLQNVNVRNLVQGEKEFVLFDNYIQLFQDHNKRKAARPDSMRGFQAHHRRHLYPLLLLKQVLLG